LRHALRSRPDLTTHLKNWLRLHALTNHFRRDAGLGFLSGPSLMVLFDRCSEVAFGVAHAAQTDGLLSDSWLFIQRGEVALHDGDDPSSRPRILGPGDCFGEKALLGGR